MTSSERQAAVRAKVAELLVQAKETWGVDLNPDIRFDLSGKVAGWAINMLGFYRLRFNMQFLMNDKHYEDMLTNTVPHEVAHLVCFAKPKLGTNHNRGWKDICRCLGGNGLRCHSYDAVRKPVDYMYRTTRGHDVVISPLRHAKIQAGATLRYKSNRGVVNRKCAWAAPGQSLPEKAAPVMNNFIPRESKAIVLAAPIGMPEMASFDTLMEEIGAGFDDLPAPETLRTPPAARTVVKDRAPRASSGTSKAATVRAWIRVAKDTNATADSVVQRAQAELGMGRALAQSYVAGNWNRV